MKKNLTNKISFLLVLMLVAAMAFGCGTKETTVNSETQTQSSEADSQISTETEETEETEEVADGTEAVSDVMECTEAPAYEMVGEGQTTFYFVATDQDGNSQYFEVATDETTVGAALLDLDMIAGDESDYGLYVKTVLGITADYDVDGTYWAFYIDGEYASTGVDSTDIVAGSTYSFVVEK